MNWGNIQTAIALLLLTAGVVTDLRSRKVPNQLVVIGFVTSLIFMTATQGFSGLMIATLSLLTAFVGILPLYMMRVFGGGDAKLFLAVSLLLSWQEVVVCLLASMIWGALLGVFQVVLKGEAKAFAHNMLALAQRVQVQESKMHKVPFTVALLLGFLTSLMLRGQL